MQYRTGLKEDFTKQSSSISLSQLEPEQIGVGGRESTVWVIGAGEICHGGIRSIINQEFLGFEVNRLSPEEISDLSEDTGLNVIAILCAYHLDNQLVSICKTLHEKDLGKHIIICGYSQYVNSADIIRTGAKAYVPSCKISDLKDALQAVCKESRYFQNCLLRSDFERNTDKTISKLTFREREIQKLVSQGLTNKEIANQLCISINTVRAHLRTIFDELGLTRRSQIITAYNPTHNRSKEQPHAGFQSSATDKAIQKIMD